MVVLYGSSRSENFRMRPTNRGEVSDLAIGMAVRAESMACSSSPNLR